MPDFRVRSCRSCPMFTKGVTYTCRLNERAIGSVDGAILDDLAGPPLWCPLREGPVTLTLTLEKSRA